MSDLIKLMCPSCGSKLSDSARENRFYCGNCGNYYVFSQKGNSISLEQIIEKTGKPGTMVLGENATVAHAENVYLGHTKQTETSRTPEQPLSEKVECPICGRLVIKDSTFRCKKCQRANICISHQDLTTYLCMDCYSEKQRIDKIPNLPQLFKKSRPGLRTASRVMGWVSLGLMVAGIPTTLIDGDVGGPIVNVGFLIGLPALIIGIISFSRNRPKKILDFLPQTIAITLYVIFILLFFLVF